MGEEGQGFRAARSSPPLGTKFTFRGSPGLRLEAWNVSPELRVGTGIQALVGQRGSTRDPRPREMKTPEPSSPIPSWLCNLEQSF